MTMKEKKLFAFVVGAGVLSAALVVGLLTAREMRPVAAAANTASPAVSTRSDNGQTAQQGTEPGTMVELTPAEITAAGVQVAEVRMAALKTDIAAFGRVEQPEAQLAAVSARISGRLDKLYVQYTGERVRSGQPVADIYSPEVVTAIEEYHLAEESRNQLKQSDDAFARTQADALIKASQHKLELWGISVKQSDAPEKDGVPHVTIYSYASGTVVDRKVTQGQYVNAGDTLFMVADLSQVWIKADVYEEQLPQIRQGQEVEITAESLPNKTLHGHVDFIEPAANPQTRTVPVHVHVANPEMRLLPGMFVSATFVSRAAQQSIVVPRSAVLDTGTRKIVYVARLNDVFEAREVQVGAATEDLFPVLHGLTLGDSVVLNGNFLIDSQAHLGSGMSGLYGGSKEFASAQQTQTAAISPANPGEERSAAKIDFHSDPNPMKAGEDNQFHVTLTDAASKPISDARITVTLIMPAMPSMGMPEMKTSCELVWGAGSQMYVGKGQAPMAGTWTVLVEARKSGNVIASMRTHLSAR
ncbi:MAG: efflux RND transporter periplasmic adaptor subunit [Terracidiphilus sp.]